MNNHQIDRVTAPGFDAAVQRRYATVAARAGGGAGVFGGLCYPIKSWTFAGYSYYSESCRLVHADGIVRDVPLPWAVRYTAGDDPFAGTAPQDENLPLPLPPPNWKPSAGQEIVPDIAELLRENGYHI